MKTSAPQRGFTLIELLVVIGIIALMAAITVPAIGNMRRSDTMVAATRQLLDDVGRARQLAISKHTTVYMVFVPLGFWTRPEFTSLSTDIKTKGERLYDKQLTGYNFVTLRSLGDQPGQSIPDYYGSWHIMPENTFIPTNKFYFNTSSPFITVTDPPDSTTPDRSFPIVAFSETNNIPFPSEDAYAPGRLYAPVRYIAFNYLGQLVSGNPNYDEFIPVARGTVAHARDPLTKKPQPAPPSLIENPPGNSTNSFNLIQIDRLTGRARLIQQEVSGK